MKYGRWCQNDFGNLTEDVHMTQLEGFVDPKNDGKVCKLKKFIYGLKKASQSWNLCCCISILYVVDILVIGNDIPMLEAVKSSLRNSFWIKYLGEAAYILGIKIYRDRSKTLIGLSQDAYIDKILNQFNMQDYKKGFLPMSHDITLSKKQCPSTPNEQERMRGIPYASAIGTIMYAILCMHPDVSYALSATSSYQSNYGEAHWTIVKNILKYLRSTKEVFIMFGGEEELVAMSYTSAIFQIDTNDSKSQSSFVFYLNRGGAVSLKGPSKIL
jgi:hypothetical protein